MNLKIITLSLLFAINTHGQVCNTPPEFNRATPKRDIRGVFLTTVFNLNWPSTINASTAVQKAELISILDHLKDNGYNAIFFQVRTECDALYRSDIEPWSRWLTGVQGLAPAEMWDPLEFVTQQAHQRGMDLHAWLNPYRAKTSSSLYQYSADHVTNKNPSWVFSASNNDKLFILNPGLPEVRAYINRVVQDIITRYDVDGIHFDDYFYPSGGMAASPNNQDAQTHLLFNPRGLTLFDWRRDNVNQMIAGVYDLIQNVNEAKKKNTVFGVSPFGIWKSGVPLGVSGNSSYSALYCDPLQWLEAGKVDYLAPQLYWRIGGAQDYLALSSWWNSQAALYEKQIYPGLAFYRIGEAAFGSGTEIQDQISINRSETMMATYGMIAYNYSDIKNNDGTINSLLNGKEYANPSFAPPIEGKDNICPLVPANVRIEGNLLKWETPLAANDGDKPKKYVIYAFDNTAQAITNREDGAKIIGITASNQWPLSQSLMDNKKFVVSSLDKNNNENGDFGQLISSSKDVSDLPPWSIYPNPTSGDFSIRINKKIKQVKLYNISGQCIYAVNVLHNEEGQLNVQMDGQTSGMYIINLLDTNGQIHRGKVSKF
ncbi:MAG: family 10 glycosylhydrolase [Saprospiraceae bacterium]